MVHKRFGILLMFVLLALTPVCTSLADEYEGDNESYYDDQLAQLGTVTSGDWLYLVQADGTIALQRYQGNGVDVTVPVTLDNLAVTMVGSYCFPQDTTHSIIVPEGITTLNTDAFLFSPVEMIVLSEGLLTIGDSAFYGCDHLTALVIPSTVTTIGVAAFQNCDRLTNLTLPNGLSTLPENLLSGCASLDQLVVPASVQAIDESALPKQSTFVLVGSDGSYTQTYAQEHGIAFTEK